MFLLPRPELLAPLMKEKRQGLEKAVQSNCTNGDENGDDDRCGDDDDERAPLLENCSCKTFVAI